MSSAVYLWKTFREQAEQHSGVGQKVFGFVPESVFGFSPEWCSESARNPVRLHPGTLFGLPRNTHLTFGQARAGERRPRRREVLRRRLGTTAWLMPIPIPLRKIAAFVEGADPNLLGNLIAEGFRRNILPSGCRDKCDAAFFLRMLAAGKCILLFDGLDEVSDDKQFQSLTREIVGLMSQYSSNKFVITSRYAGWRGGVGVSFETFDVEDLSDIQSSTFIRSWY